jgi:hypothetical protein
MRLSRPKASVPVRIIASIHEQHFFRLKARQEFFCEAIFMGLASRQSEPDRQAIGIDHRMFHPARENRIIRC